MTPSKDKDDKNNRKTASVEAEETPATRRKKKSKTTYAVGEAPREIDIVCGRGCGHYARAPGNVSYRRLVGLSLSRYEKAEKHTKVELSREIVQVVKAQQGTPRFLMENPTTKVWEELSYTKSVAKTSQTFRDLLGSKTSMSKATSDDESKVDDESVVPMMNNRMPTTASFLPPATKRRFTTGRHPPRTTADWKPCPQDTAAHDMDEMRLLLQEIHSEEIRREKYKYVPETPPVKRKTT